MKVRSLSARHIDADTKKKLLLLKHDPAYAILNPVLVYEKTIDQGLAAMAATEEQREERERLCRLKLLFASLDRAVYLRCL